MVGESEIHEILCEQLKSWGFRPELVPTLADALKLSADRDENRPFLAALVQVDDPHQPAADWLSLVERLRQIFNNRLIAMIPSDASDVRSNLRQMGFCEIITQPIKQSETFNAIMNTIAEPKKSGLETESPNTQKGQPRKRTFPRTRHPGARILVAEDNAMNQQVVSEFLKKLGYACEVVADGGEAVRSDSFRRV